MLCGCLVAGGLELVQADDEYIDAREDLRCTARLQLDDGHDRVGIQTRAGCLQEDVGPLQSPVAAVWNANKSEFGELCGEALGNIHHDVYVIGQKLVTGGPEIDRHTPDDDWVDTQRRSDRLDDGDDLKGALCQIRHPGRPGKLGAKLRDVGFVGAHGSDGTPVGGGIARSGRGTLTAGAYRSISRPSVSVCDDAGMGLLAVKLTLAPAFVVGVSLASRRFGPRVGGLSAGLPVVAGPILLVYALGQGRVFASGAAGGALLGLVSLTAFLVVYSRVGAHASWRVALLAGWLTFALATAVLSTFSISVGAALAVAAVGVMAGLVTLPYPSGAESAHTLPPPRWDLPLRAACAAALVLTLAAVSGWLGPRLSGLLAPFPVIATVLATFTHAQRGVDDVRRMARGMVTGFCAFAAFCFTVSVTLRSLDIATSFVLATVVALATQAVMLGLLTRGADTSSQPGGVDTVEHSAARSQATAWSQI